MKREIEILKWLNHKNVIRVFDVIDGENKFFIVMEMAPKGDLLSLLLKRYKLTENEAKAMFKSIVDGVLYCHKKGECKDGQKVDYSCFPVYSTSLLTRASC